MNSFRYKMELWLLSKIFYHIFCEYSVFSDSRIKNIINVKLHKKNMWIPTRLHDGLFLPTTKILVLHKMKISWLVQKYKNMILAAATVSLDHHLWWCTTQKIQILKLWHFWKAHPLDCWKISKKFDKKKNKLELSCAKLKLS